MDGRRLIRVALFSLVCAPAAAAPEAVTFVVTSTASTFDGSCDPADCTLRDAIDAALQTPVADDILLQSCATYTLTSPWNASSNGFPVITSGIRIIGSGATIERSGSASFRFFEVGSTGSLWLENLTLRGGSSYYGGAIFNAGQLTIDNAVLESNQASFGGAIYNQVGTIQMGRSSLRDNVGTYGGGGLYSTGSRDLGPAVLRINDSAVVRNGGYFGGGIQLRYFHDAEIVGTTISDNFTTYSDGWAGGIYFHQVPAAWTDSLGNAIPAPSRVEVVNSTITNNRAGSRGGGIAECT